MGTFLGPSSILGYFVLGFEFRGGGSVVGGGEGGGCC